MGRPQAYVRSLDRPAEQLGNDVRGIAVCEAARIAAFAAEGEVLVTADTRQLAADAQIGYEDRG